VKRISITSLGAKGPLVKRKEGSGKARKRSPKTGKKPGKRGYSAVRSVVHLQASVLYEKGKSLRERDGPRRRTALMQRGELKRRPREKKQATRNKKLEGPVQKHLDLGGDRARRTIGSERNKRIPEEAMREKRFVQRRGGGGFGEKGMRGRSEREPENHKRPRMRPTPC